MNRSAFVLAALFTCFFKLSAHTSEELLERLDREVSRSDLYIKAKEDEITHLKGNLKVATSTTDRYLSAKQIALAYAKFNSDSAIYYLQKCIRMGHVTHNPLWVQDSYIRQAFIYADRGDGFVSTNILTRLGTIEQVDSSLRTEYAKAKLMRHVRHAAPDEKRTHGYEANASWILYAPYIDPNSIDYLLFRMVVLGRYDNHKTEAKLKKFLKKIKPDSFDEAMIRALLYSVYKREGRKQEAFDEMAKAATTDIRCANRSSTALLTVIEMLNKDRKPNRSSNSERLLSYVKLCAGNIAQYKDVGRSVYLVNVQKNIEEQYVQQMKAHERNLVWMLLGASVIVIVTALVMRRLYHRYNRHKVDFHKIHNHNNRLMELIDQRDNQLAEQRAELSKLRETAQKADIIMSKTFALGAELLKDIRTYKKDMANMLQTGLTRQARKLANSAIIKDQSVQELYRRFDDAFLTLHPDFVEQFNAVIKPESRSIPKQPDSLTPELRIYALIALGVTDSVNISEILQYSTQTVYNYRLKMRHATIEPKFELARFTAEMYRKKDDSATPGHT